MASAMLQTGGFVLGVLGVALVIAATVMNNWSTKDRQGEVLVSVYNYKGLWRNCEVATSGITDCRPLYGLLGYSASFQAVRALMIVGIVMGVIASVISLFSLKCFKVGNMEDTAKANMTLTAGIMFVVAGLCGIAGVSIYANQVVASFTMATYNPNYGEMGMGQGIGGMQNMTPRYTFGPALFVGWIGGGLLLIGAVLKCIAYKGLLPDKSHYNAVAYKAPINRTAVDDDRHSEGARSNQKYV